MGNYDGSIRFDTRVDEKGFNKGTKSIIDNTKGLITSLKAVSAAIAGAFVIRGITDTVKEAEKLTNAMTGLKSIMDGQGKSFSDAQKFIKSYTKDGLIPQTEAITAYKNLALRGYDTSQIQQVMNALKDSATYGRQASYTLGQAVESASEGLKNENSILVDNAGVTKNVAKMWEDYAKSIGKSSNELTKQERIQAEVAGILEETKYQTGDASTYADTYSGMVARLNATWLTFKQTIGGAFMQVFQTVIPIIQTVINYLIDLANTFTQVVSLIFNKQVKSNDAVAKSSKAAAGGLAAQGNAAEKAGKQAKNATLAFDDLNILQQETNDSSKDNGVSGISIPGIEDQENEIGSNITISPNVQIAFDYLKSLTSGIDFTNVKNSLNGLKDSLDPFTETIFDGLKWGLENVIMPIVGFSINKVLPDFLDILSNSISILDSVLKGFEPLGNWLWNNILKPMAEFTAGALETTLEGIVDILKQLSDWASENQPTIDSMVTAFSIFFGLWKLTELMAFIQMSGGLAAAIGIITTAIWSCTGAKIADKLETIALTAMYAKDFLISVVEGTGALLKQIIQWGLLTGAKTLDLVQTTAVTIAQGALNAMFIIGTTVTTALAGAFAFLTSPIGLVIVAFGLLIGLGVLLYRNWDTIRYYAGVLWDNIKVIFASIGAFIGDVFNGIVNVGKGAINLLIDVFNAFLRVLGTGINALPNTINSILSTLNMIPGIDIPLLPRVSMPQIPRLATGAVIPPNAEFMAVLGDQKNGRNLEAPEDLIRQIVREEGGTKTIIVKTYLDSRQISEAVNEINETDARATGDYSGGGAFVY